MEGGYTEDSINIIYIFESNRMEVYGVHLSGSG
jgi:hypothetical protein